MLSQGLYYLIRALVPQVELPMPETGHALASALQGEAPANAAPF